MIKLFAKYIIVFAALLLASSCAKSLAKYLPERPINELKEKNNPLKDPNTSPEFKQGWADGCESGMAGSNTFYQTFYDVNKVDGYKMSASSDYRAAWSAAFWYCTRVDWVRQTSPIWGSIFGGYR